MTVLQVLCTRHQCEDLSSLLLLPVGGTGLQTYFGELLGQIAEQSCKDKECAIGVLAAFQFLLHRVVFPHISEYIAWVLPPALILVDDYRPDNKRRGLCCLAHILQHCSKSELHWYGRAELIYSAIHSSLYTTEADLLDLVLPTIIQVIQVTDSSPDCPRLHEMMQTVLSCMRLEDKLSMRRIYARHLPLLIGTLGLGAVRHYQQLFSVLFTYLEVQDNTQDMARIFTLSSLQALITHTWPRIHSYTCVILKNLHKLVIDLWDEGVSCDARQKMLENCSTCVSMLIKVDLHSTQATLQQLAHLKFDKRVLDFIDKHVVLCEEERIDRL